MNRQGPLRQAPSQISFERFAARPACRQAGVRTSHLHTFSDFFMRLYFMGIKKHKLSHCFLSRGNSSQHGWMVLQWKVKSCKS
jgi:hypothetical protein